MNSTLLKLSRNFAKIQKKSNLINRCTRFEHSIQLNQPQKNFDRFDFHFDDNFHFIDKTGNSGFWRRKMRTVHNLLDVNKDGIISYDDFKLLADRFVKLGNLSRDQQIEFYELIKNMWREQWGCIDRYNLITTEQYLEDMKHVVNDKDRRKKVHRILPYLFSAVDSNNDGTISFAEYQIFFKCLGLSYKDALASFESIDRNKDGKLTLEEFVKLGREYFLTDDENNPSKLFWGPLTT